VSILIELQTDLKKVVNTKRLQMVAEIFHVKLKCVLLKSWTLVFRKGKVQFQKVKDETVSFDQIVA